MTYFHKSRFSLICQYLCVAFLFAVMPVWANAVSVTDDQKQQLKFKHAPQRIIALSPAITEMLYAIGADKQIIAAVSHSDYPPPALNLPRVGGYENIDIEKILALQPDLIIAWLSGNNLRQLATLQALNIPIFFSEPKTLADIASTLLRLGMISGHQQQAQKLVQSFEQQMTALKKKYATAAQRRVMIQIWDKPLMAIGADHVINDLLDLCAGVNIFQQPVTSLSPEPESILRLQPELIIMTAEVSARAVWRQYWQQPRWQTVKAVQNKSILAINNPDVLVRHSPRILQGAEALCSQINTSR